MSRRWQWPLNAMEIRKQLNTEGWSHAVEFRPTGNEGDLKEEAATRDMIYVVLAGKVLLTTAGATRTLSAGDEFIVPSDTPHKLVAQSHDASWLYARRVGDSDPQGASYCIQEGPFIPQLPQIPQVPSGPTTPRQMSRQSSISSQKLVSVSARNSISQAPAVRQLVSLDGQRSEVHSTANGQLFTADGRQISSGNISSGNVIAAPLRAVVQRTASQQLTQGPAVASLPRQPSQGSERQFAAQPAQPAVSPAKQFVMKDGRLALTDQSVTNIYPVAPPQPAASGQQYVTSQQFGAVQQVNSDRRLVQSAPQVPTAATQQYVKKDGQYVVAGSSAGTISGQRNVQPVISQEQRMQALDAWRAQEPNLYPVRPRRVVVDHQVSHSSVPPQLPYVEMDRVKLGGDQNRDLFGARLGVERDACSEKIVIRSLTAGGPAHIAGISVADQIISWDGVCVDSFEQFQQLIKNCRAGQVVQVGLLTPPSSTHPQCPLHHVRSVVLSHQIAPFTPTNDMVWNCQQVPKYTAPQCGC